MTLEALLTLLREGILNDRTDRIAGTPDYLWTDETLVTYINEAQRRMARLGFLLRDGSTPGVTEVTLAQGQTEYVLHESVFAVISAKLPGSRVDLARVGHSALNMTTSPNDRWQDPAFTSHLQPGAPLAFGTDEELASDMGGPHSQVVLRVYPEPSADQDRGVLKLRVYRMPLADLTTGELTASPEIPRDHHIEMLDWAAYLALRIVDEDAGAARAAREFRASFEEHVKRARNHAMRKLFAPTGWKFGQNGFNWGP